MKVIALIVLGIMLMASVAVAENTSGTDWTTPSDPLNMFLNKNATHSHGYEQTSKYKSPLGIAGEVTLYEMDVMTVPCALGITGQYDLNNGVWGAMSKVSVNLSPMIKKFLGQK